RRFSWRSVPYKTRRDVPGRPSWLAVSSAPATWVCPESTASCQRTQARLRQRIRRLPRCGHCGPERCETYRSAGVVDDRFLADCFYRCSKNVSRASFGANQLRPRALGADFLAQAADLYVDRPVVHLVVVEARGVEQ